MAHNIEKRIERLKMERDKAMRQIFRYPHSAWNVIVHLNRRIHKLEKQRKEAL